MDVEFDVDFDVDWRWQLNSDGEEPLTIEMALARADTHTFYLPSYITSYTHSQYPPIKSHSVSPHTIHAYHTRHSPLTHYSTVNSLYPFPFTHAVLYFIAFISVHPFPLSVKYAPA
jgi:hypothetical protein